MALDRSPRGADPAPRHRRDGTHAAPTHRGHHRAPAPVSPWNGAPWHGRIAIAAVATGATVAGGFSTLDLPPVETYTDIANAANGALIQSTPTDLPSRTKSVALGSTRHTSRDDTEPTVLDDDTDVADVESLTKAVKFGELLAGQALKIKDALSDGAPAASIYRGQEFVNPTVGNFTSGFGGRWGVTHYGIDLANKIGTPIYAVTEGTVISSGPASGFGMWVRIEHPGGWISVYGHINRSLVHVGEKVDAGEKIAEMGNRGQSTGPHLHFEIWDPSGKKLNPLPWLATRGIRVSGNPGVSSD